jgi:hypothetical protein
MLSVFNNSCTRSTNNRALAYKHKPLESWRRRPVFGTPPQYLLTPWLESASELYRPTNRRLSAKLVPTSADRGCHVVSVTVPYGRILGFLDRSRYFFFQVAPQLYSRGLLDPVPDPLLLRKSGSSGNRTRTSGSLNTSISFIGYNAYSDRWKSIDVSEEPQECLSTKFKKTWIYTSTPPYVFTA